MKEERATEIAALLSNASRWHLHSRGIGIDTLKTVAKLRIDDLAKSPDVHRSVREYFDLLTDYMARHNMRAFVHTRGVVL